MVINRQFEWVTEWYVHPLEVQNSQARTNSTPQCPSSQAFSQVNENEELISAGYPYLRRQREAHSNEGQKWLAIILSHEFESGSRAYCNRAMIITENRRLRRFFRVMNQEAEFSMPIQIVVILGDVFNLGDPLSLDELLHPRPEFLFMVWLPFPSFFHLGS